MTRIFNLFVAAIILTASISTANAQDGAANTPKTAARSKVTTLYKQLSASYLKTTEDQNAKAIPILTKYDVEVDAVKVKNAGNAAKTQQEVNAVGAKAMESLKKILNGEQSFKLLAAISTQENIVSGKNLDANQKAFVTKAKNEYKLSEEQLTAVALVIVQGKLRGDVIAQLAKTNSQQAGQEYIKLFQDLDGQLKSSLSGEQYKNVRADIEKMIKGQKV